MKRETRSLEAKGFGKELEIHSEMTFTKARLHRFLKVSSFNLGQEGSQISDLNPFCWNKVQ